MGPALTLRLAGRTAKVDPTVTDPLTEAAAELDALEGLRELARGIHPAIVTDAGLVGALETLAERPGVPVELSVDLPGRLPESVEVGAYYLVAEALANANKHANAGCVRVRATVEDDTLHLAVSDDGQGGAAARSGSGLEGLADRMSSLAGWLVIERPAGRGTTVTAIPLRLPAAPDVDRRRVTALKWIGWETFEVPGGGLRPGHGRRQPHVRECDDRVRPWCRADHPARTGLDHRLSLGGGGRRLGDRGDQDVRRHRPDRRPHERAQHDAVGGGGLAFLAGLPQLGLSIFVVVVLNSVFAFVQESRADRAGLPCAGTAAPCRSRPKKSSPAT